MLYLLALFVAVLAVAGVAIDMLATWPADYGREVVPEARPVTARVRVASTVEARPYGALTRGYGHPWPSAATHAVVAAVQAMDAPAIPARWT